MTPPSEGTAAQMEWERQGQGNRTNNMSDANPENFEEQQRTIVNKPMPEASLTSKRRENLKRRVRTPWRIKKKVGKSTDDFESILEHLKIIVEELESSNVSNIDEVLGMYSTHGRLTCRWL